MLVAVEACGSRQAAVAHQVPHKYLCLPPRLPLSTVRSPTATRGLWGLGARGILNTQHNMASILIYLLTHTELCVDQQHSAIVLGQTHLLD